MKKARRIWIQAGLWYSCRRHANIWAMILIFPMQPFHPFMMFLCFQAQNRDRSGL